MVFVCLAIPGKIVKIDAKKEYATIDYGAGIKRTANISLVQVKKGQYVLVHAGFAIQVLEKKDALETLSLFKELQNASE